MLRFILFSFFILNYVLGVLLFDFFISFIEMYAKIYFFPFFITNYILFKIL